MIGEEYYYCVTYNDDIYHEDRQTYMHLFFEEKEEYDGSIVVEYRVKLKEIRHNYPNKNQLCNVFEILEIFKEEKQYNKIGETVYSWCDYTLCPKKDMVHHQPQCGINDGGCLNCSGCYSSLVIPWDEYKLLFGQNPVTIEGKNVYVKIIPIYNKIQNVYVEGELAIEDDEEYLANNKQLFRKGNTYGYFKKRSEFCLIDDFKPIAIFFGNHLK
jgi:hypothetical protein